MIRPARTASLRIFLSLYRLARAAFRIALACLWLLVRWPPSYLHRLRYYLDVVRAGGLLWLAMQTIRRFQFVPFTLIDALYYRLCRAINLTSIDSYSTTALYVSGGSSTALRNFIIDLDTRRHVDPDLHRTRRLEVAIAGRHIESGSFFSVAHLFPDVQDVHFYMTPEQLSAELPFFIPEPRRNGSAKSVWITDLDNYPIANVLERFKRGNPISIRAPALGSWKAMQPFIHALLNSRTIVVLNLPSFDGSFDGVSALWADFFTSLYETKKPHILMVIGAIQSLSSKDLDPNGTTVFYASQLGMDFRDCLALVRESDAYVGAFDEFGLMTIGTNVPAILIQPDAAPPATPIPSPRYIRSLTGQILSLDPLTGRQIFEQYHRMISALRP